MEHGHSDRYVVAMFLPSYCNRCALDVPPACSAMKFPSKFGFFLSSSVKIEDNYT